MNHPILTAHYRRIGRKGGSSRSPRKLAALAVSRAKLAAKRVGKQPFECYCSECDKTFIAHKLAPGQPWAICPDCAHEVRAMDFIRPIEQAQQTITTEPIQHEYNY